MLTWRARAIAAVLAMAVPEGAPARQQEQPPDVQAMQPGAPQLQAPQPQALAAQELERLLAPELSEKARHPLVARLVAQAQSDGSAAFYLGALYRSGMDHPAQLFERDLETSRHWLQKCVEAQRCPLLALASLAELELAAGNPKAAMQWAQAWVILEREVDRQRRANARRGQTKGAHYQHTSYQAYLLKRCYKAMPNTIDQAALGRAWFDELRKARGTQLDRMLFAALEVPAAGAPGQSLELSAENQRTRSADPNTPMPRHPALALYLYRGAPGGGRPESLQLIEALPAPRGASWLALQARSVKMKPYQPETPEARLYAELPLSFNDWEHSLIPED